VVVAAAPCASTARSGSRTSLVLSREATASSSSPDAARAARCAPRRAPRSANSSCSFPESSSTTAASSTVPAVAKIGACMPCFTTRGMSPQWSRCACVSRTASIVGGSYASGALLCSISFGLPWNMPQSMRIFARFVVRRNCDPVTVVAAPRNRNSIFRYSACLVFGPLLVGERVTLRPADDSDPPRFVPWFADMEVTRWLGRRSAAALYQELDFFKKVGESKNDDHEENDQKRELFQRFFTNPPAGQASRGALSDRVALRCQPAATV